MGRPKGSTTGKGLELAHRWAVAFGSREMLSREILGRKNPFEDYKSVQEIERRMAVCGIPLQKKMFDNKSKTYALAPEMVEHILNEGLNRGEVQPS